MDTSSPTSCELSRSSLSSSQDFLRLPPFTRQASVEGDRFIPCRNSMDTDLSHFSLTTENMVSNIRDDVPQEQYKSALSQSLYNGELDQAKVLSFKSKAPGSLSLASLSLSILADFFWTNSSNWLCCPRSLQSWKPTESRLFPPHPLSPRKNFGRPRLARRLLFELA
jgi:hypothetical protein